MEHSLAQQALSMSREGAAQVQEFQRQLFDRICGLWFS
jgi:hypothetical protein